MKSHDLPEALIRKRAMDGCPVCLLSSTLCRIHGLNVLKLKLRQGSGNLTVFVSRDAMFKCEGTGRLNRNYVYCRNIMFLCFCHVFHLLM
jgi:hypothetical protein